MLLFYPKPYSQETLLSFIYRIAKEHEMTNFEWMFELINKHISIKLTPERINWLKGDELKSVAKFIGITYEEAEKLTVYHHFKEHHTEVRNESKNTWFLYKKTRFCPLCLKEEVYQQKSWISCHSIMCLKHNSILMDCCYHCKNIPNTNSIIMDKCINCNNKLSNSPIKQKFPKEFIEYQQIMNQILEKNRLLSPIAWIEDPATFLKALDYLAIWVVKMLPIDDLSIMKYNLHFTGNILERNHLRNYRSIEQSACLFSYVFNIINNWPSEFNEFMRKAVKDYDDAFRSFINYGIPRIVNTSLWEISKSFTNYLAKEKGNLSGNQYIRSDEVKFLHPKFNGSIINSNLVNSYNINIFNSAIKVIDKDELQAFMNQFENSYTKEELRTLWGTSAKATFSILNNGLIEGALRYKSGSAYKWVIPKDSIYKLVKQILQESITNIRNPISFNHAVEWTGPDKAHLLLRNILKGSIKYACNSNKMSDLILEKRETYFQIREEIFTNGEKSKVISYRDISFLLGIKNSDIKHWINSGRFGELENVITKVEVIPFQNFLYFHKRFITTLELAIQLNLQIKLVIKKCTIGKLNSISGPKFNDGKRLLFLRQHCT